MYVTHGFVVLGLSLSFIFSGCGSLESSGGDVNADGASVYAMYCANCHGTVGEGTEFGYQVQQPVTGYATWVIRNGRTGSEELDSSMPDFNTTVVSDTVLTEILDYLSSQPRPTTGEGLYKVYCGNCHGAMGSGGAVSKNIARDARREPEELLEVVREGEGGNDYADRKDYMPSWTTLEISDAEVWMIAQYLGAQGSMPSNWSSSSEGHDDDDDD